MSRARVFASVAVAVVATLVAAWGGAAFAESDCTITFSAAGGGNWNVAANWAEARAPAADDHVCLGSGAAVTVSTAVNVAAIEGARPVIVNATLAVSSGSLEQVTLSGRLSVGGRLAVTESLAWASGTVDGAGTLAVASSATMDVAPSQTAYVGTRIENAGTVSLGNGSDVRSVSGAAGAVIASTGTITRANGSATANLIVPVDNDGVVASGGGRLALLSGGSSTGRFATDTGTVVLSAGTFTLNGATLGTGTAIEGGTLQPAGDSFVEGHVTWSGATLNGPKALRIKSGATLEFSPSSTSYLATRLENAGTVSLGNGSDVRSVSGAAGAVIASTGTITRANGSATANLIVPVDNDGVVASGGGRLALLSGGSSTGRFATDTGTVVLSAGTFTLNGATLGTGTAIEGGTLQPAGDSFVEGHVTWSGATLNGPKALRITSEGTLEVTASSTGYLATRLENAGTLRIGNGADLRASSGTGFAPLVVSTGTITRAAGTSSASLYVPFDNAGVISSDGGRLNLGAGGTSTGRFDSSAGSVALSAGTFTLDGATLATGTSLEGGVIAPITTSTVEGRVRWSGATLNGIAALRVSADATLEINPSTTAYLATRLENAGTLSFGNGADLRAPSGTGFSPLLANTGTITRSAGTSSAFLYVPVENDGTVSSNGGRLSLAGGGGTSSGSFGAPDGGEVAFSSGGFALADATFGRNVTVDGGTVNIAGGGVSPAGLLRISGGRVTTATTITVGGSMVWSGGTVDGTGSLIVAKDGTLSVAASSSGYLDTTLENAGTITLGNGADIRRGTGSSPALIHNTGTITRSAGTSAANVYVPLDNDGAVASVGGRLSLIAGGEMSTGSFTALDGAEVAFSSGTFALQDATLGRNVTVDGGTVNIAGGGVSPAGLLRLSSGRLTTATTITVGGSMVWSGGTVDGTGSLIVAKDGTLSVATSSTGYLDTTLENTGTITLANGAVLRRATSGSPALIHSTGTITRASGTSGAGLDVPLDNDGLVTSGGGRVSLTGGGLTSSGSFTAPDGSEVAFSAGVFKLRDASLGRNVTVDGGDVDVSGRPVTTTGTLRVSSGWLSLLDSTITVAEGFVWSGGTVDGSGSLIVSEGGALSVANSSTAYLDTTLENAGTLTLGNGAVIRRATSGSPALIHNAGTVTRVAGTSGAGLDVPLDNDGVVTSGGGRVTMTGGGGTSFGDFTAPDGSEVAFSAGTFALQNASLGRNVTVDGATVNIAGGDVRPTGTFRVSSGRLTTATTVTIGGAMAWSGGVMDGAGSLVVPGGGTVAVSASSTAYLDTTLENAGTLTMGNGAVIRRATSGSPALIHNAGTVTRVAGTSGAGLDVPLDNDGVVTSGGGRVTMTGGGGTSTGSFTAPDGSEVAFSAGYFKLQNAALEHNVTIDGGDLDVSGKPISATGTLRLSSGSLSLLDTNATVTGALAWSGGRVDGNGTFVVAATAAASMAASSTAYLDTTLENAGTLTMGNGAVIRRATSGSPALIHNAGTVTRVAGTSGAGLDVPLDNDGVVTSGGGRVTMTGGGGTSTGTFTAPDDAEVAFSAGLFKLQDASLARNVTIDGGDVDVSGKPIATTGTLRLSSGWLSLLDANVTVAGALAWSGGRVDGNGTLAVAATATVNVATSSVGYLDTTLENAGTLTLGNGADIRRAVGSSSALVHNTGTITRTAGTSTASISVALDNDGTIIGRDGRISFTGGGGVSTGTFSAPIGSELAFSAGAFALQNSTFEGAITIDGGTVDVSGAIPAGTLRMSAGRITGAGRLDIRDRFDVSGGQIELRGVLRIAETAVTEFNGTLRVIDATVDNRGMLRNAAGRTYLVDLSGRARLRNSGTVIVNDSSTIAGTADTLLLNLGTIRRPATGGRATISAPLENNGVLDIDRGELQATAFRQTTDGSALFHVAGADAFGRLTLAGTARVAGSLKATSDGGSTVAPGTRLRVVSGGIRDGEFAPSVDQRFTFDQSAAAGIDLVVVNGLKSSLAAAPSGADAAPEAGSRATTADPRAEESPGISPVPPASAGDQEPADPAPPGPPQPTARRAQAVLKARADGAFALRVVGAKLAQLRTSRRHNIGALRLDARGVVRGSLRRGSRDGRFSYRLAAKGTFSPWTIVVVRRARDARGDRSTHQP
ncbi:hypothetical protein OM076_13350 [Solirubrobacter ginsenosidimutans]|uniref:Autotransporter domain-containing protein n=1 Tax=Solirubrobacter ginsenosidimutans TaxID=490573 RepID=A0A9X3MTG1_9ACTN|nr:hypothetical protein [Solirubrobacter ginsenosidimutans]MDA0161257.1 hypothetical protein [Solirubrobacter ginsenosidimutans]